MWRLTVPPGLRRLPEGLAPMRWCRCLAVLMLLVAVGSAVGLSQGDAGRRDDVDHRWLDRLDRSDRVCIERLIGYAPPAFRQDLTWISPEPLVWPQLRGKVVVVQTWTSRTASGRNWALRASRTIAGFSEDDVQLIALHSPEGADTAGDFLRRRPLGVPVVIDTNGRYCDQLGVYKRPVNIIVDRNGAVRYAGLNQRGIQKAVAVLITEAYDPTADPQVRPAEKSEPRVGFPPFTGGVSNAVDIRGRRAPPMYVAQWLNGRPDAAGKVVVLDFWATWCAPCRASIPHMNELADQFREDVVCVGLSDEKEAAFARGMGKYKLTMDGFRYSLALDTTRRMKDAIKSKAVPHALVMSSDWIVRWQGHPASLTPQTLAQIVQADQGGNHDPFQSCDRWAQLARK